jgi:hypothetical protein
MVGVPTFYLILHVRKQAQRSEMFKVTWEVKVQTQTYHLQSFLTFP